MPPKTADAAKLTIYKAIRADIISGLKKPGERLSIDRLKEKFGTSVTPVRDALQMLSQEELVTIKPRSGYYVTLVTLKELNDMMDLRGILELAVVERAVRKITDEQIRILEAIPHGYTDDRTESFVRYTEENRKFHVMLAEFSGNHELALQVGHLHDRLARFMVMSNPGTEMIDTHARVLDRLKARDAGGAVRAVQKELAEGKALIMERIMEEEASFWHLGTAVPGKN
ncbi:MAG: GntR family transcriptional regulator [Desulfobacterales bacterium]|nr:GntR family transcriptional regulator [Desulfobacterales bacterium]